MNSVILYHTTNESSLINMRKLGYIGLTQNDYKNIVLEIINFYNITNEKIVYKIIDKFINIDKQYSDKKYVECMKKGCVSFFPNYESCLRIKNYSVFGGEYRGSSIKSVLKIISRYFQTPFKNLQHKDYIMNKYCGVNSKPVILKFNIPISLLCEFDIKNYNDGMEIISCEKIPIEYLKEVIFI